MIFPHLNDTRHSILVKGHRPCVASLIELRRRGQTDTRAFFGTSTQTWRWHHTLARHNARASRWCGRCRCGSRAVVVATQRGLRAIFFVEELCAEGK